MGLDMYLTAEKYAGGYDFMRKDESWADEVAMFDKLVEFTGKTPTPHAPGFTIKVNIAYWRKANAIHDWFIQTAASGTDDCRPVYVSHEQIQELIDLCKETLDNREKAEETLPTKGGFFFGSTEYDEYYFSDLEDTVRQLEHVLVEYKGWDLYYLASW